MAVNKVVYGGRTLIDLTEVTVTADKLLEGYTALDKSGTLITGTASPSSGSVIAVDDVADSHGGTIRTITAVSLEGDTVSPSVLASGYTAHNAAGEAITGTLVPGITPSGTIDISTNGTHDVTNYASAYVHVQSQGVNLQTKTDISPTESSQTITPDSGYDGLTSVQINAISSTYVGSGIDRNTSSDLTASGATVTAPAGYYASAATKTIASGSVTAPSSISGTSASVSTGTNTLTLTKSVSVTPNVTTAGYIASGTAGNASVSLTANVTTKAAATITPGTSNQTIAAGTYLTGAQTIAGDANLVGSSILAGRSIFGVAGTVAFQTYYTGSSAPSSSLGSDGDIYLQTT